MKTCTSDEPAVKEKWVRCIDPDQCTGCGLSVESCRVKWLELANRIAVLSRPETCGSDAHCISLCPTEAMQMVWLPLQADVSAGLWR